ncbi:(Fe-S)-binding protein [Hydrogenibacillus sp. N12]|uniref:(Fe-S)-binding protein n=1 Tax=Hydrogenibacillus sp. N12 TaxID=2866627 RepID=UPI001C7D0A80|nr:(Fe-S)-binding protein [Hydrogenibacillus sp. N12]QZA34280.1 (Fe-S)-binding protein [Hydrogenibacillus sp. N12]
MAREIEAAEAEAGGRPGTDRAGRRSPGFPYPDPPQAPDYELCVHCGLCLDVCPTYLERGEELHSPRGRVFLIRQAAEGRLPLDAGLYEAVFQCLDCRACETACPSGVPVGRLIEAARGQVVRAMPSRGFRRFVEATLLRGLIPHPRCLDRAAALLRLYQRSGLARAARALRLTKLLPPHLRKLERALPAVRRSVRRRYPEALPALRPSAAARAEAAVAAAPRSGSEARPPVSLAAAASAPAAPPAFRPEFKRPKRVGVFTGCVMDVWYADVNEATVRVLRENGYDVVIPKDQRCCGALHVHAGDRETGKALARANLEAFLSRDVDAIVVNAAGCGAALKEYGHLLAEDPERERAEAFAEKVYDVSEFLVRFGFRTPTGRVEATVTYHEACHLAHAQGIREAPRALLRSIPGLRLVEMPEADHCCGSAGIYNLTHPEMAEALLRRKVANVPAEAEAVAMGNPGCMLQIASGLLEAGRRTEVVHTVALLDRAYRAETHGKEEAP